MIWEHWKNLLFIPLHWSLGNFRIQVGHNLPKLNDQAGNPLFPPAASFTLAFSITLWLLLRFSAAQENLGRRFGYKDCTCIMLFCRARPVGLPPSLQKLRSQHLVIVFALTSRTKQLSVRFQNWSTILEGCTTVVATFQPSFIFSSNEQPRRCSWKPAAFLRESWPNSVNLCYKQRLYTTNDVTEAVANPYRNRRYTRGPVHLRVYHIPTIFIPTSCGYVGVLCECLHLWMPRRSAGVNYCTCAFCSTWLW